MPFIVRCPHCRRFMLVEDEQNGTTGECLLCKHAVLFSSSSSGQPSSAATVDRAPAPVAASRPAAGARPTTPAATAPPAQATLSCVCANPQCGAKLKFPAVARGKNVQCPKCAAKFVLR